MKLKYRDKHNFTEQLLIIEKGKYEANEEKVKFAIQNPLVEQYFEYEIRKLDIVSDGSFAKHVVTIGKLTFEKLLVRLYGDGNKAEQIIAEVTK